MAFDFSGVGTVVQSITGLIEMFVPDKEKQMEAKEQLQTLQLQLTQQLDAAQAAINQQEASNTNLFVSGWRPAVGWLGVTALAWQYVFQPVFVFFFILCKGAAPALPTVDLSSLISLLVGMLGFAGLHAYENIQTQK